MSTLYKSIQSPIRLYTYEVTWLGVFEISKRVVIPSEGFFKIKIDNRETSTYELKRFQHLRSILTWQTLHKGTTFQLMITTSKTS